jgi:hypothetical protein
MFNFLLDLAQDMSRDALGFGFRIEDEKPNLAREETVEVDDPYTASLATSSHALAHLAYASRAGDDIPCLRVAGDERYERATLVLGPVVVGEPLEERRFDDGIHE